MLYEKKSIDMFLNDYCVFQLLWHKIAKFIQLCYWHNQSLFQLRKHRAQTSRLNSSLGFGTKILLQYSKVNVDLIFLSVSLEIHPQNHINCSNFLKCFIKNVNITPLRTFPSFSNEHQLPIGTGKLFLLEKWRQQKP